MGYVYFVITLQTMEKRFKIPSQTTGERNFEKAKFKFELIVSINLQVSF